MKHAHFVLDLEYAAGTIEDRENRVIARYEIEF